MPSAYLAHLKAPAKRRLSGSISAARLKIVFPHAQAQRHYRRNGRGLSRPPSATACQAQSTTDIKGATVNRELECLKCVFDLAVKRKYIPENPAAAVKHFNELRERPVRRMLTVDEEIRIVESAPTYLRVAIVLLSQTGGRTYSEGLSLRWD